MHKVKEHHPVFRQASTRQTRLHPHKVIYVCYIFIFISEKRYVSMCILNKVIWNIFKGDIKFHDPTEFATNNVNKQDYVNTAQSAQAEAHAKVNAPHAHQAHGHGIGENLDAG